MNMLQTIGFIAAIGLPLWNIPLLIRIIRRKSSNDISLAWAVGVWACLVLMLPSGLYSADGVFRIFTIVNVSFFTVVMVVVMMYRKSNQE